MGNWTGRWDDRVYEYGGRANECGHIVDECDDWITTIFCYQKLFEK